MQDTKSRDFEATRFVIAIPYASDTVPIKFAESMMRLERTANTELIFVGHTITSAARNLLVKKAQKLNADYILFVDSDMVLPPDTLRRLWDHDVEVVSGLYMPRRGEGRYMALDWNEELQVFQNRQVIQFTKKLLEVDGAGGGCLMVRMDVFDKLQQPFFFYNDKQPWSQVYETRLSELFRQKHLDVDEVDRGFGYGYGEDLNFFLQLRSAGIQAYVDTSLMCGHLTMVTIGENLMKRRN